MGREYVKQVEVISQQAISGLALLTEDFESTTLKWTAEQSGGLSGAVSTLAAYNGNNGYRMTTRSVGAANTDYQGIVRFVGITQRARYNFSLRQRNFGIGTAQGKAQYIFTYREGFETYTFEIHLSHLTFGVQYRNRDGVMTLVPNFILSASPDVYTRVEIQFNVATKQYEFIAIGRQLVSLADLDASFAVAPSNNQDMAVRIRIAQDQGGGGAGAQMDVDDIVMVNFD